MAVLGGLALIGAIALMGVGMAQAQGATGGFGPWATGQNATQQTPAGWWGPMMGGNQPNESYGPGGMMGGNGMMSGYGSAQQNPASAAPVSGNTVTIQNFAFQPANVQVTVGTTVTWTNNDTAPHTVTFRDGSLTSSGILRQGDTYSYTFTKVGTFSYYCAVHTYMIGEVIVTAR
jgi:amicyanin